MQRPTVVLDAAMSMRAALRRLARNGLWRHAEDPEAAEWIGEVARRLKLDPGRVAALLARELHTHGVAIRREWHMDILWYGFGAKDLFLRWEGKSLARSVDEPVMLALGLVEEDGAAAVPEGIPPPACARPAGGWPTIECPDTVVAERAFEVAVGLAQEPDASFLARLVQLAAPGGASTLELEARLTTTGFDSKDGWSQPLRIAVADPTRARAVFRLVPHRPSGPQHFRPSLVEASFLWRGAVCATASRPVMTLAASAVALAGSFGTPWLQRPARATPFAPGDPASAPDLTIEICHPDASMARGIYASRLSTPHAVAIDTEPHQIDLGEDSRTFARMIADQVRAAPNDVNPAALDSIGLVMARKLHKSVFQAIEAVARELAPRMPSVLLLSPENCIPWELASCPVLDPGRPARLGTQVDLVRCWRDALAHAPAELTSPAR